MRILNSGASGFVASALRDGRTRSARFTHPGLESARRAALECRRGAA